MEKIPPALDYRIGRRTFLELLSLLALPGSLPGCAIDEPTVTRRDPATRLPPTSGGDEEADPPFVADGAGPFRLGVASADPLPHSVLLWTRVIADPLAVDGGVPADDFDVEWIVTRDEALREIVTRGVAKAPAADGHSVHVEVTGLEPSTTYYYAFRLAERSGPSMPGVRASGATLAGGSSRLGRTRTLPPEGTPIEKVRFAVASCQNWQEGYYTAHAHLAEEELDFVLFLGDYIYEEGIDPKGTRRHDADAPRTLEEYRRRHALYKSDENLQAAHAAHPWIAIWDDHEVAGNYASRFLAGSSEATFLERRAAAYKAYWEHVPLRAHAPEGPELQVYRQFVLGDLARLVMLDGRQYRSHPACDGKIRPFCAARDEPERSMLGEEQERWLTGALEGARERWKLIGNNVMMAPLPFGTITNNDQWDGFTAERKRLLDVFARVSDVVVLTGDIHATLMSELPRDPEAARSDNVGVELVTTAISSGGVDGLLDLVTQAARRLPHIKYVNARERGYLVVELMRDHLVASLRGVATVDEPTSPISTVAAWRVERGTNRVAPLR